MPTITDIFNQSETIKKMLDDWGYTNLRIGVPTKHFNKNMLNFVVTIPEDMDHSDLKTFQLDLKRKLNCSVCVESDETLNVKEISKTYKFPEDKAAIEAAFSGVEFEAHRITEKDEIAYKFMFDTFVYRGLEEQKEERKQKRGLANQTQETPKKAKTLHPGESSSSPESHESASGSVNNAKSKDAESTHPPSPSITLKS